MSKNAATIAEAISLLSDVLVHDTAWDTETETVNSNEYDDLKEQQSILIWLLFIIAGIGFSF